MSEPTPSELPQWEIDKKRIETISDSIYLAIDDRTERALLLILDELAALRAQVAEQRAWRERAEVLLRAIVDVRQHLSIDEARALLGEGGQ